MPNRLNPASKPLRCGSESAKWLAMCSLLLSACSSQQPAVIPESEAASRNTAPCSPIQLGEYRWIEGGQLEKGKDARLAEEAGEKSMKITGFWLATHEVTQGEFAEFIRATGYQTLAERDPPPLPGAPPEMMQAGSAVFAVPVDGNPNWWRWMAGANWQQPYGPDHPQALNPREPVVHIGYEDALAFAKWKGKQLPSEDQWEWAARSGGADPDAPPLKDGKPSANIYQGSFPFADKGSDGFVGRAPVGCYPPDKNGLYDMIGNVWEWTADAQDADHNIIKGGSYLCASNYCARYRPAARQFQERSLGTDHIGFRLMDAARPAPAP